MNLTEDQLIRILPLCRQVAAKFVAPLNDTMARYKINTPKRMAAFLANAGHESGHLRFLEENLNYSADGLAKTWPSRFKGRDGKPNQQAMTLARNPKTIANVVYANRMGNGNEVSGDGYNFRGRGIFQVTGRENYKKCGKAIGVDAETWPDALQEPVGACLSAGWYWDACGLNAVADVGDFDGVCDRINIGRKTKEVGDSHGYDERKAIYDRALKVLG